MSLQALVEQMNANGSFKKVMLNRSSQFGRESRQYLGARFLPERLVPNNSYTEANIKYRTVIANDGSRYSPAQKKGNDIFGSMDVKLEEQDIASEFTSEDYDNHITVNQLNSFSENNGNPNMIAEATLSRWVDARINLPLVEKVEKMRWEAIVDATIKLRGDNGYSRDVTLSNPAGHRVAASDDWTDATFNPLEDLYAMQQNAIDKNYELGAIVCGRAVLNTLLRNPLLQTAVRGYISVDGGGALVGNTGLLSREVLNRYLVAEGLPPIITYDLQYRTQVADSEGEDPNATSQYFLKRDVLVGLALTGRDTAVDLGDEEQLVLRDTIGYVGVGRAAGQSAPGRASSNNWFDNKPPRVEFEGWQTTFPVVTDPESIFVINSITTA